MTHLLNVDKILHEVVAIYLLLLILLFLSAFSSGAIELLVKNEFIGKTISKITLKLLLSISN